MTDPATAPPALEVRHLSAGYSDVEVLRDVSLIVRPGEVAALLGANGAGKTTLLRSIAGFLTPSRGEVRVAGDVVTQLSPYRRLSTVAYVPEGRGIFRSLSVAENIRLFAPPREYAACRDLVAERFPRLADRFGQKAGTLSGGEQQMLAIARVFMGKPQLVLLDEVSLGLAPMLVDLIFESLERLRDDTTAVLLVEQYVSRALRLADTAHILRRGQIAFSGAAAEIDEDALAAAYFESEVHGGAASP